jgi:hypothetical protein
MLCISSPIVAQGELKVARVPALLSAADALEIARERFPNLCCAGILPRKAIGEPVDLADVEIALAALARCRKTRTPTVHSFDLRRAISKLPPGATLNVSPGHHLPGDVQLGAVIAASVALGFPIHSWFGITTFAPHAMIAVNKFDVRKHATNISR